MAFDYVYNLTALIEALTWAGVEVRYGDGDSLPGNVPSTQS